VHPQPLRLELPDPVVAPGGVEPADEEQVVPARDELVEAGRRRSQVDLMEDRGRERVGVAEEDALRKPGEEVLVPALDARDVCELPARPRRVGGPAEFRVWTAVFRIPEGPEPLREGGRQRRLPGGLRPEQAHPFHPGRHAREPTRDDGGAGTGGARRAFV